MANPQLGDDEELAAAFRWAGFVLFMVFTMIGMKFVMISGNFQEMASFRNWGIFLIACPWFVLGSLWTVAKINCRRLQNKEKEEEEEEEERSLLRSTGQRSPRLEGQRHLNLDVLDLEDTGRSHSAQNEDVWLRNKDGSGGGLPANRGIRINEGVGAADEGSPSKRNNRKEKKFQMSEAVKAKK